MVFEGARQRENEPSILRSMAEQWMIGAVFCSVSVCGVFQALLAFNIRLAKFTACQRHDNQNCTLKRSDSMRIEYARR